MSPSLSFTPRKSEERGHADHGWLKTFHTFSFANYYDGRHAQYGSLRVINEDRVSPRTGFGMHSHREFEIFSYIVSGSLEHKDSMGNTEILKRGDLQMTSTGTGIAHSEKTHGSKPVHFLQIWAMPNQSRLPPTYYTRHFTDEEKTDKWCRAVAPTTAEGVKLDRDAAGPAPVHSSLTLYASILSKEKSLSRSLEGSKGYVHVIQTSGYQEGSGVGATVRIDDGAGSIIDLREGDGAYVTIKTKGAVLSLQNVGDRAAELLVFDLD